MGGAGHIVCSGPVLPQFGQTVLIILIMIMIMIIIITLSLMLDTVTNWGQASHLVISFPF